MVDDPFVFGQIAAVNALSDVYAMGGNPIMAMNLMCFPSCIDTEIVKEILAGGLSKVKEAGAIIAGGHTIADEQLKYGLSVMGFVHPSQILTNASARECDLLILTKPLGTGILTMGARADALNPSDYKLMTDTMTQLNARAKDAMLTCDVSACTDITGFGLMGHVYEMAKGSQKTIEVFTNSVPIIPKALQLAKEGLVPGGTYRNLDYIKEQIDVADTEIEILEVLCDPQTAGGLLIAVSEKDSKKLLNMINQENTAIIGQVSSLKDKYINLK